MPLFIDDGYTLEFSIPERPGIHEAITGHRRPTTAKQRIRFWHKFDDLSADEKFDRYVTIICSQIVDWSIQKPLKPETFTNMGFEAFDSLTTEALKGYEAIDEKNSSKA